MIDSNAGCGGVLRDDRGGWIAGYLANLGIGVAEEDEAWGLYYGLKIAWEKGLRKIIIDCDSKIVVDWI